MDPTSPTSEDESSPRAETKLSRRDILKYGALSLASAPMLTTLAKLADIPTRAPMTAPPTLPAIQFDIGNYIAPVVTIDGIPFRFGPAHTLFATAKLTRQPTLNDQRILADALDQIESVYPFSPSGVFTVVSYGMPYLANHLPAGLVQSSLPKLLSDPTHLAMEEAGPAPTDVSSANPGVTKPTYNISVVIEANDMLFTWRSDNVLHLADVSNWMQGSNRLAGKGLRSPVFRGLFTFTSQRYMFGQRGLPRKIADAHNLPYANRINSDSIMWMGFADQQVVGAGPAEIVTFQGNASARFTNCQTGDYFFNGSVQPLSHVILDLAAWYADDMPYVTRAQLMFRSTPPPSLGNTDQFTNGGGPTFLDNAFQGTGDAANNAAGIGTYQGQKIMGHLTALQQVTRAADGTPLHIRIDGPGFDNMDMPRHANQPKLQFSAFLPAASVAKSVRRNQSAMDLVTANNIPQNRNGVEYFSTTTRRQFYLVPPRAHRAFPLLELA